MKTFKELLNEQYMLLENNRIEFTKNQFKDKISTDHDPEGKAKTSDKVVDLMAKHDPSSGKQYTGWMTRHYASGSFTQKDAPKVGKLLSAFETHKNKLEHKDINQYSSVSDLRDTLQPHMAKSVVPQKTGEPEDGLEKVHDEDGVKGFKIPSRAASIKFYGSGGKAAKTTWCTAANSSNNMFDHYTDNGKKGLYTAHTDSGHVFQFSHEKNELRDVENRTPFIGSLPEHEQNSIRRFITKTNPGKEDSKLTIQHGFFDTAKAKERYTSSLEKIGYDSKKAHSQLTQEDRQNSEAFAERGHLNDDDVANLLHFGDHTKQLVKNTNLTPEQYHHLDKHLTAENSIGGIVATRAHVNHSELARNPSIPHTLIEKMHKEGKFASSLAQNTSIGDKIGNELADNQNAHHELAKNEGVNLSKESQMKIYETKDPVRKVHTVISLLNRHDIHPDVASHAIELGHRSPHITATVLGNEHIKFTPEQFDKMITASPAQAKNVLESDDPRFGKEETDKAVNALAQHKEEINLPNRFKNKNVTPEHLSILSSKLHTYSASDKLSKDDITKQIELASNKKEPEEHYQHILRGQRRVDASHLGDIVSRLNRVPDYVSVHPKMEASVFGKVSDSASPLDRRETLKSAGAQKTHFEAALSDKRMHGFLSNSPKTPAGVLDKMKNSQFKHVRENIINNKNTDRSTLLDMHKQEKDAGLKTALSLKLGI